MILLIYPALLLAITFLGAESAGKRGLPPEFPDSIQAKMIRASACVGVIIHHVTQQITGYGVTYKGPVTVFNDMGILFTAVFFFFSGFGLVTSLSKKEGYLRSILTKRIPTVLIPFWCVNLLGVLLYVFVYRVRYSLPAALSDVSGLTLINGNGWFFVEIVVLYLAFYLAFRLIRNRDAALVLVCVFTVILIVYAFFNGHDDPGLRSSHWFRGEWWYNSTAAFIAGMLFARFRSGLTSVLDRHYRALLPCAALIFVLTFSAAIYAVRHYGYYHENVFRNRYFDAGITLAAQSAACLFFVFLVVLLNMRIKIGNPVLGFLSRISTELFLIHGFFVTRIFGSVRMSDPVRFLAVFVSSIACAAILSPGIKYLVRVCTGRVSFPENAESSYKARKPKKPKLVLRAERRRRAIRAAVILAGAAAAAFLAYSLYTRVFRDRQEYAEELRALREAGIGDTVFFGRYNTDYTRPGRERLTWIVVKREEGKICLLCEQGIAGGTYNNSHTAVSWEESDLHGRLNSPDFTDMFSGRERQAVAGGDGDIITLLTAKEAAEIFRTDKERELSITKAAEAERTNVNFLSKANGWDMKGYRSSWWWLRGDEGTRAVTAPIVTVDGSISIDSKEVNRPYGAIRPVIWVYERDDE